MRRARWVLVAAFALSLLAHAIVATVVRSTSPSISRAERITKVQRASIVRRTPAPAPSPRHRAPHIAVPRIVAAPARRALLSPARRPAASATTAALATPQPAPGARCSAPDAPAAVVAPPAPPAILPDVRALDVSKTAAVNVQLDSTGEVTHASIEQSTGDASFDALAISMANDARYAPAHRACTAIASSYLFRVEFYAW